MKKCIIIGAGDFNEISINKNIGDLLIVADAGYKNFLKCSNLNLEDIDILVGDFDSMRLEDMNLSSNTYIHKLNAIKDDTDIVDACKDGIEKGYKYFEIYGALGGRIEHSIANIGVISWLKEMNKEAIIKDQNKILRIIKNEKVEFDESYNGYFSCFSLVTESYGVNIKNMKYELNDYTLKESFPLGIDNEFVNKKSVVEVKNGKLLLIYNE